MPAGRPKIEADIEKAEELASRGLTVEQISHCLGMAPATFYERQRENVELAEAVKRGRSKGIKEIANALYEAAKNGNIVAQIFYLKNRGPTEWQDRRDFTIERKVPRQVEELSDDELLAITGEQKPNGTGIGPANAERSSATQ